MADDKDLYVARLESVVKQMLQPLKNVPFSLVIEATTSHKVIEFNKNVEEHVRALSLLVEVGKECVRTITANKGIESSRPNEVGNYVEPYVKAALNKRQGVRALTPITASGKRRSAGYPDIEVSYGNQMFYLECKTYNGKNIKSSQRSFYFSPSEEFKVTRDALHFLIAFEMRPASGGRYFACGFSVFALQSLALDVKYEFNSDNRRLYSGEDGAILLHRE